MANYDYDKSKLTNSKPSENGMPAAEIMMPVINKAKLERHDMQHHKDMELAAMLQAHWAHRVESEHRPS